jgi:hypothetical protein
MSAVTVSFARMFDHTLVSVRILLVMARVFPELARMRRSFFLVGREGHIWFEIMVRRGITA